MPFFYIEYALHLFFWIICPNLYLMNQLFWTVRYCQQLAPNAKYISYKSSTELISFPTHQPVNLISYFLQSTQSFNLINNEFSQNYAYRLKVSAYTVQISDYSLIFLFGFLAGFNICISFIFFIFFYGFSEFFDRGYLDGFLWEIGVKLELFLEYDGSVVVFQSIFSYYFILFYYYSTCWIQLLITSLIIYYKHIQLSVMKQLQFYRVQQCNGRNPFLINTQTTLSDLYSKIKQQLHNQNFIIYYHFKQYPLEQYGSKKLKQIVAQQPISQPLFVIYNLMAEEHLCDITNKYGEGLVAAQKTKQEVKQYSVGENGLLIFDNRHTSILASSVNHATSNEQYNSDKKGIVQNFNKIVVQSNDNQNTQKPGLIKNTLMKIGFIKKIANFTNIMNTILAIKNIKTKQDLVQHIDRQYSDYDPKFAAYLQAIYLKYAIMNGCRLHYIQYKNMHDGVIKYKFPNNAKIAIIGDYGTGLSDSFGLLLHAVIQKQVDVILHLGDVYYAGTPNQYKNHIVEPLNLLRKQAGRKFKKDVLFYSIPGNHDYYTWGMPFLCFIANVNQVKQITGSFIKKKSQNLNNQQEQDIYKQQASYFCLQSADQKWQFIGLDTAYHDSNPFNQINGLSLGPRLRKKQVDWFVDKMQHFPGSTILLTHHQLFSIHDRICGSVSQYRTFSCINPLLSAQLFKYLPVISCWYWGHQHSLMFFKDDVMGVRKCRLLGNSSFHVFQKQGPYLRKKNFPYIPLIQEDQKYSHKYLPLNPQPKQNSDCYYNLSYALIDFGKQKVHEDSIDQYTSTLTAQYYCCPCYFEENAKQKHFKSYLLYQQQIQPRINVNIVTSQKLLKNEHSFVGNVHQITQKTELVLKSQIGLYADKGVCLSLSGKKYKIIIESSSNQQLSEQAGAKFLEQSQNKYSQDHRKSKIKQKNSLPNNQELTAIQNKDAIKYQKQQQQKKSQSSDQSFKRLLLDGDIISLVQVISQQQAKKLLVQKLKQQLKIQHKMTLGLNEENQPKQNIQFKKMSSQQQIQDILKNQPKLSPIFSIQSSTDQLPKQTYQILDKTILQMANLKIFDGKTFQIKKSRILKDISLHIKFGDAFTLKQTTSNLYLACHIGAYGGILKLREVKTGEQPCLFMFLPDSKVK